MIVLMHTNLNNTHSQIPSTPQSELSMHDIPGGGMPPLALFHVLFGERSEGACDSLPFPGAEFIGAGRVG